MCESCLSLPLGVAVSMESHPWLGLVDCVEVDGDPVNRYEHYCCVSCQTRWIRYVDRWGTDMGFRLGEQSYDVGIDIAQIARAVCVRAGELRRDFLAAQGPVRGPAAHARQLGGGFSFWPPKCRCANSAATAASNGSAVSSIHIS